MSNSISIDVIFSAVNKTGSVFGAVNKGLNGLTSNLWKVNQTADLLGRASDALNQIGAPGKDYDFGLAELSSITGIAGSELTDLGKIARKVGKESGLGATGSLEAYKLLASQIEVDKIGLSGLNELQKRTITLAQASPKLGLEGAANSLAGTINQFGLEANQANRVMNVLAAGSKYGAAEIPDLAQSFKVVGASAAAAGLDVETTAGAIEVLSKNNLKGSEAGTALRNVLLKMQTDLGFDFKVTKLSDALTTLQGKEGDAAYMAKIFGAENIAAAQFLVKNAQAVDEMTKKVTGTTVATEQAAIMNKTWVHWMDVQKAKMNDLSITFFQANAGLLSWVQMGGQAAMTITALSPVFGFLGKSIMGVGSLAVGSVKGIMTVVKATRLMNMALAAGNLSTVTGLIARYGMAGRIAAGGIWLKNGAVTFGTFIGKLFNAETRKGMFLQMQQALVSKVQAAWTWIVSKSQMVAAGVTSLWGKRMMVTGAIQAGWSKVMALSSLTMKGLFTSFTGLIAQTWAWTAAIWANPITWIVGGVLALVAGIALAWKHFAGFRGVLVGTWEGMKKFGEIIFGSVLGGLKQLLAGIGKIGQAIALLFKGQFKEAGKTALAGFGDIGKGAIKMSPIGVAVETIKRKDEIGAAVSSGYSKGKNMDTSNFMNFGSKKKDQAISANDMQVSGMDLGKLTGQLDVAAPNFGMMKLPGMMDMQTPAIKQAKLQGKIVNMAIPNPGTMQIPGMMDMQTPAMKQAKLQGKIVNMAKPKTTGVPMTNTPAYQSPISNLEQLTKNITQNIANNNTTNQNTSNNKASKIEINYQPQVHVSATMTKENQDNLMKMLYSEKDQLMKLIKEELRKDGRLSYAG